MLAAERKVDVVCVALAVCVSIVVSIGYLSLELRYAVAALFLAAMSASIIWSDLRLLIIPEGPIIGIIVTALSLRVGFQHEIDGNWSAVLLETVAAAAVCGGCLWLVRELFFRLRGFDGMGLGDVKLAVAGGALIGIEGFAWALLISSVAGLAAFALMSTRSNVRLVKLPFGALLAPACTLFWLINTLPGPETASQDWWPMAVLNLAGGWS